MARRMSVRVLLSWQLFNYSFSLTQAMEIHSDYIIYFINFVIYVVLCVMIIKQAKKDLFAPKKKEKPAVLCPTHGCPVDVLRGYEEYIRRSWIMLYTVK